MITELINSFKKTNSYKQKFNSVFMKIRTSQLKKYSSQ